MSRQISTFLKLKQENLLKQNGMDVLFTQRLTDFRNLQTLDPTFQKRKEKLLWPIYEFNHSVGLEGEFFAAE